MLQKLREEARGCLQHAEDCLRRAEQARDSVSREEFLAAERHWIRLAHTLHVAEGQSGLAVAKLPSNAVEERLTQTLESSNQRQLQLLIPVSGACTSTGSQDSPGHWHKFGPLFHNDFRGLLQRVALAMLLYAAAVIGRELLHEFISGPVRYLTFYPALLGAGILCGTFLTFALLAAFMVTGLVFVAPPEIASFSENLLLSCLFAISGAAVVLPALYAVRVQSRLRRQDEQLATINQELKHRLKNALAIVTSICHQSFDSDCSEEEIRSRIIGRIQALARAQDFLSIFSNEGSDLRGLVETITAPLCPDLTRLRTAGPSIFIPSTSILSFTLVLHELATNAVKYGAWRPDCAGQVSLQWSSEKGNLRFVWRECGVSCATAGPPGFGSKLIKQSLRPAKVDHTVRPDGLECTISDFALGQA